MFTKYIALSFLVVGSFLASAQAAENFTCLLPIAQQMDIKQVYNVDGEQNPPMITYDFSGPEKQYHYFKVISTGKIVHELEEVSSPKDALLTMWLQRVSPKTDPTAPAGLEDGVRMKLETTYGEMYAGLGMRDSYNTYVQNVTAKLSYGRLALIMVTCFR